MKELEKFIDKGIEVVRTEHKQMKECPKCHSKNTRFTSQALVNTGGKKGDVLNYICENCKHKYSKFFPFPEEYLVLWQKH